MWIDKSTCTCFIFCTNNILSSNCNVVENFPEKLRWCMNTQVYQGVSGVQGNFHWQTDLFLQSLYLHTIRTYLYNTFVFETNFKQVTYQRNFYVFLQTSPWLLWETFSHTATTTWRLFACKYLPVCSQVFIHTVEWTRAMWNEQKHANITQAASGDASLTMLRQQPCLPDTKLYLHLELLTCATENKLHTKTYFVPATEDHVT